MALDELEYKFDTRWEWCSNQTTNEWSLFDSKIQQILNDAFENKLNTVYIIKISLNLILSLMFYLILKRLNLKLMILNLRPNLIIN